MTVSVSLISSLIVISIHILHTKDDDTAAKLESVTAISIHILHTKDDILLSMRTTMTLYFNPHPSYEG